MWRESGGRGNKAKAHEAWVKMGRWPWRMLAGPYAAYLASEDPAKLGAVQHLATWLNQRGHQQEWRPWSGPVTAEERARAAARERERIESERRLAATNRKLAEERALKARLDAEARAREATGGPVDIRRHLADLATQKSAEALDDTAASAARR